MAQGRSKSRRTTTTGADRKTPAQVRSSPASGAAGGRASGGRVAGTRSGRPGTASPAAPPKELAARARRILSGLKRAYPEAACALRHRNPLELFVATVLSAQCTDERVNQVTPALFARCRRPEDYLALGPAELEAMIRPTGFYRAKAKSILGACRVLVEEFGGEMPRTMEELLRLPGAGRKTANVVLGEAFGVPGITVDTHVQRLSGRLGLTAETDPVKIEFALMPLFPRRDWTRLSHLLIHHGRACCVARRPACERCPLSAECPYPAASGVG